MMTDDGWFRNKRGNLMKRYGPTPTPVQSSDFPTPMVIGDSQEAVQSMADGKYYTSKSAMRRSYRADGNPEGIEFHEVGNDPSRLKAKPKAQVDEKAIEASVGRAISRVKLTNDLA